MTRGNDFRPLYCLSVFLVSRQVLMVFALHHFSVDAQGGLVG